MPLLLLLSSLLHFLPLNDTLRSILVCFSLLLVLSLLLLLGCCVANPLLFGFTIADVSSIIQLRLAEPYWESCLPRRVLKGYC